MGQIKGPARSGEGGGEEVEARKQGGRESAVLRAEGILFLPQSVAPVPVWQMTLGENQGNEVGIAQAQEKGHKGKQSGSVQQEEMGTQVRAAGQASGSRSLGVHG